MTKKLTKSSSNYTDIATSIAGLKAILFDSAEANHTKIELIKEELLMGRYDINPSHIASKLLEYAQVTDETEIA